MSKQSFIKFILSLAIITIGAVSAAAQTKMKVTGTVTDAYGPIVGATVQEKGTTNGVITDVTGAYEIKVGGNATLVFMCMGYETQEIAVKNQATISTTLKEDTNLLEETVVVGYGTQKKVNLTGSVASVNVEREMQSRTVTNLSNVLEGAMAGVAGTQSSGAPGSDGTTVRVRGLGTLNSSSPLVLIDGMEGSMDALNPQDVESISVLKDAASSAIYGAKAANGVILVTTKKGRRDGVSVNYSGHMSVLHKNGTYGFVTNYADYMELMNEAATNVGNSTYFSQGTIDAWRAAEKNPNALTESGVPNYVAYPNTDWEKELFDTNILQEHSVSINGGGQRSRYLASASYQDNPGIVDNTGLKRFTMRTNIETNVTDWLTVGTNTYALQNNLDNSNFSNVITYLGVTNPGTYPYYDGYYGTSASDEENSQDNNLKYMVNSTAGNKRVTRFNTTAYAKVKFLKHFEYDFNANYTRRIDEQRTWSDNTLQKKNFLTGNVTTQKGSVSQQSVSTYNYGNYSYTLENLLRYNQTFGKHDVSALAGYQEYYYQEENVSTSKQGTIDYTVHVPSAFTEMKSITGTASATATRSFFGRINYAYAGKYLFEANLRYDGSSRFHKDSRWGIFPSFSAGWRISEEPWMQGSGFDNLKLRASWGQLGNSSISEYLYQSTYGSTSYSFNGTQASGLAATSIANSSLKWETTTVTNLGIDLGVLNNRLTAEIDVYNKLTDGILYQPTIYLTAGNKTAPYQNIAEVTNRGVELSLGWRDTKGDFTYQINGNISYNLNRVSKYKGQLEQGWETSEDGTKTYKSNIGDVSTGGSTRVIEGKIINEYYLYTPYKGTGNYFNSDGTVNVNGGPKDGMIRTEDDMAWVKAMQSAGYKFQPNNNVRKSGLWYGDYIYADNNEDGIYGNTYDQQFTGYSSRPPIFYGFQLYFAYKNVDLSASFAGTMKSRLYWGPSLGFNVLTRLGYEMSQEVANDHYYYDPENPTDSRTNLTAKYGRYVGESGYQANVANTNYLYKANYLKLKNITLGYTLPSNIANKIYMKGLRVYINGENLFTLTKYPGFDPELGAGFTYLTSRSVSLGASITF